MNPLNGAKKLVDFSVDNWKNNRLVVHGKRNSGDIPFYVPLNNTSSWTLGNTNFTLSDDSYKQYTTKEYQRLCVSSTYPGLVGFTDNDAFQKINTYTNQVCNKNPTNCTNDNVDKGAIKSVNIGLYNSTMDKEDTQFYNLTMKTNDFVYVKGSSNTLFEFLNFTDTKQVKYGCTDDADMVVGRQFLSKFEVVLRLKDDNGIKAGLGFAPNESTSSVFLIILIILGCIILAICIAIILLKVCKRKSEDNAYQNAD